MFTVSQTTTALTTHQVASRPRRVLIASKMIGNSRKIGYSFAAIPSPMSTPAATGRLRAQAHRPHDANAIASRSQFEYACMISSGDSAKIAAS